jgi:monoamine oxidase
VHVKLRTSITAERRGSCTRNFAGEQTSNQPGWQKGAMLAAYKSIGAIAAQVAARKN